MKLLYDIYHSTNTSVSVTTLFLIFEAAAILLVVKQLAIHSSYCARNQQRC
jgi:hypothetical protein